MIPGTNMGPEDGQACRRRAERSHKMGYVPRMGANTHVRPTICFKRAHLAHDVDSNAAAPRLASSSKDGTVRVWLASTTRRLEYTLGGHSASVNVVRWGGGGMGGKSVLYTASSDRTVRVWDASNVGPAIICSVRRNSLNKLRRESRFTH
jgi:WD40 repeat protein